jgi:hypothetical protein
VHGYLPENVTWGTNALNLGTTVISGGTWQGGTIASGYGGTGLTTFTAANNALYSTSASALAAGTLPVLAGGTGVTTSTGSGANVLGTGPTITGAALNGTLGATTPSTVAATTGSFSGAITSSVGGAALSFTGATSNYISYNTNGIAAPTFTTSSTGTKVILYPQIGAAAADYAIGIESGFIWNGVPTTGQGFKWYGGTTLAATLSGTGNLTAVGTVSARTSGIDATASFSATTTGGSYVTQYTRRGSPFTSTVSQTGSSYAATVSLNYTHNTTYSGLYTLGVLNESAATAGSFNVNHIDSTGANIRNWTFQGSTGNFASPGAISASTSLNSATATITPNASGVSTGLNVVNGDITTYRTGGTTGVIYLSSSGTRYLFWDGTSYQLNGAAVVASNITAAGNTTGNAATATTATNVSGGTVNSTTLNVAGNGSSADPYGTAAVTEPANANNYSYYGSTRAGQIGLGFGITGTTGALGLGANSYWMGQSGAGSAGVMTVGWVAFNGSSFNTSGSIAATTTVSGTTLTATSGFILNGQIISASYTIPSGNSAMSAGPITINSGVTVTVPSGSRWVVV